MAAYGNFAGFDLEGVDFDNLVEPRRCDDENRRGRGGEYWCVWCHFSSPTYPKFYKHLATRRHVDSKTCLFVCKMCSGTWSSYVELKSHACKNDDYHDNIVEYQRTVIAAFRDGGIREGPVIITASKSESNVECNSESTGGKFKSKSKYFFNPDKVTLFKLSTVEQSVFDAYTKFRIQRPVDVRLYFDILFMRCCAQYWPFRCVNSVELVFKSMYAPFARFGGEYYVMMTRDELRSVTEDSHCYDNWTWVKCTSLGDLARFVREKFVDKMLDMMLSFLPDPAELDAKLRDNVVGFLSTWLDTESLVAANVKTGDIIDAPVDSAQLFECTYVYDDCKHNLGKKYDGLIAQCRPARPGLL